MQGKGRVSVEISYWEAASRVAYFFFLLFPCLHWLEGPYEDKHAYWREVQVSNIKLGQNGTGSVFCKAKAL